MNTKEAYYFSHDSNARNDEKMLQLRAVYKSQGYGWYWILIEMMRDATGYMLQYDGKYSFAAIAKELDCPEEAARQFVNDCIYEFQLFRLSDGHFYSESLRRRMGRVEQKRQQARDAITQRWDRAREKKGNDTDVLHAHNDGNTDVIQGKESKGKDSKEKNNPPIVPQGDSSNALPFSTGTAADQKRKRKGQQEDPVLLPFPGEQFAEKWAEWMEYKKDRKEGYKSPKSVKGALTNLVNLSGGDEDTACRIIDQSISNSWKGFWGLKDPNGNNISPPAPPGQPAGKDSWLKRQGMVW